MVTTLDLSYASPAGAPPTLAGAFPARGPPATSRSILHSLFFRCLLLTLCGLPPLVPNRVPPCDTVVRLLRLQSLKLLSDLLLDRANFATMTRCVVLRSRSPARQWSFVVCTVSASENIHTQATLHTHHGACAENAPPVLFSWRTATFAQWHTQKRIDVALHKPLTLSQHLENSQLHHLVVALEDDHAAIT